MCMGQFDHGVTLLHPRLDYEAACVGIGLTLLWCMLGSFSAADFARIGEFLHEVLEECKATQRASGKKLAEFSRLVAGRVVEGRVEPTREGCWVEGCGGRVCTEVGTLREHTARCRGLRHCLALSGILPLCSRDL